MLRDVRVGLMREQLPEKTSPLRKEYWREGDPKGAALLVVLWEALVLCPTDARRPHQRLALLHRHAARLGLGATVWAFPKMCLLFRLNTGLWDHKGFFSTTSVIQGNLPFVWGVSLWEVIFVVSQKWSFPTALIEHGQQVQSFFKAGALLRFLVAGKDQRSARLCLWYRGHCFFFVKLVDA